MNSKMKKVVTGALIGTMTLSMAGMAFADTKVKFKERPVKVKFTHEQMQDKVKKVFDEAILKGIITQEQKDQLLENCVMNRPEGFEKGNKPPKEDREAWKNLSQEERQEKMKERLAQAVKEGKMTQEQADKILENGPKGFEKGNKPSKEVGKMMGMRKIPENRMLKVGVEKGVITQEQATEITKILIEQR